MDSFGPGDTINVDKLQSAKQHNGKERTIIEYLQDQGRYKVQLEGLQSTLLQ